MRGAGAPLSRRGLIAVAIAAAVVLLVMLSRGPPGGGGENGPLVGSGSTLGGRGRADEPQTTRGSFGSAVLECPECPVCQKKDDGSGVAECPKCPSPVTCPPSVGPVTPTPCPSCAGSGAPSPSPRLAVVSIYLYPPSLGRSQDLQRYISSFQRVTNRSADLHVFVSDGFDKSQLSSMRPDNVFFIPQKDWAGQVAYKKPAAPEMGSSAAWYNRRWALFRWWLQRLETKQPTQQRYDWIGFLGSRDVFFQDDPFRGLGAPGVYLFAEFVELKNEPFYNQVWVRRMYGQAALDSLIAQNGRIFNGDVIMGSTHQLALWVDTMAREMEQMPDRPEVLQRCRAEKSSDMILYTHDCFVDQGAVTYLAYDTSGDKLPSGVVVHRNFPEDGWTMHAPEEWNPGHPLAHHNTKLAPVHLKMDHLGRILTKNNVVIAILHQADRFKKLWELNNAGRWYEGSENFQFKHG